MLHAAKVEVSGNKHLKKTDSINEAVVVEKGIERLFSASADGLSGVDDYRDAAKQFVQTHVLSRHLEAKSIGGVSV